MCQNKTIDLSASTIFNGSFGAVALLVVVVCCNMSELFQIGLASKENSMHAQKRTEACVRISGNVRSPDNQTVLNFNLHLHFGAQKELITVPSPFRSVSVTKIFHEPLEW